MKAVAPDCEPGDRDRQPELQQLPAPARSRRAGPALPAPCWSPRARDLDWSLMNGVKDPGPDCRRLRPRGAGAGDAEPPSRPLPLGIEERRVTEEDVIFKLPAPLS
ncbi:MAG: hypothetical protein WDN49_21835 [Acetobacteraceae bacterium]